MHFLLDIVCGALLVLVLMNHEFFGEDIMGFILLVVGSYILKELYKNV